MKLQLPVTGSRLRVSPRRGARVLMCAVLFLTACGCAPEPPPRALPAPTPSALAITTRETPRLATRRPGSPAKERQAPTKTPVAPARTPTATAERETLNVAADPSIARVVVQNALLALADAGIRTVESAESPDLRLERHNSGDSLLMYERILTPIDRMSSVLEGIGLAELRDAWTGAAASANFSAIYASDDYLPDLTALLGEPGPGVVSLPTASVAAAVWQEPMSIGIVPFEALNVRVRALRLDGQWVTDNRLRQPEWPLAARVWLRPSSDRGNSILKRSAGISTDSNRDPTRLTVVVVTGVTAMARDSAVAIERSGDPGFLARVIGSELSAADITLISNEIPFVKGCVADNTLNNLILCSDLSYWLNLELSGVDAVGLTGNHQNDFGYQRMLESLAFYAEAGIPYYGGGKDEEEARKALVLENNGNHLSFLGSNQWGPQLYWSGNGEQVSAWAGARNPGSARFDRDQMTADIRAAHAKADVVFAEVQHTEFNSDGSYQTEPISSQQMDFRALSDAGAELVTGVQAHAPQALEIRGDRLIMYGLGNLYFDQTWSWPTRTGLVARHAIYDGRFINTELLVTVIETNFQLRWASPEERIGVLRSVFDVSLW